MSDVNENVNQMLIIGTKRNQGRVYEVYRGTFGKYPNVLVKKAISNRIPDGKMHRQLVRNDVAKAQELVSCPYIARIFHLGMNLPIMALAVEAYETNLGEYLHKLESGVCLEEEYDVQRVFKQLFQAVEYIHSRKIIHRDLRPKNVYIQSYAYDKWILRVAGLKYACAYEGIGAGSGPEIFNVNLPIPRNGFKMDQAQCAFIMYCFLKKRNIVCRDPVYLYDFDDDASYTWRQLHMEHLIKVIMNNEEVSTEDVLTHPFFWSIRQMLAFDDDLRKYYSYESSEMGPWLEVDKGEVFSGDDWTVNLPADIVPVVENANHGTIHGLWQAADSRNYDVEDAMKFSGIVGSKSVDIGNFEFWQKYFPGFFLHLYKRLACYEVEPNFTLQEYYDFRGYYTFPSSKAFYRVAFKTCIYESIPRP